MPASEWAGPATGEASLTDHACIKAAMGAICRQLKMWNGFVGPLPEVPRSLAFVCLDKVSLFSHGCLGTQYVDQAGLELIEICLPLSP